MNRAADPWTAAADRLQEALHQHPDALLLFFLAKAPMAEILRLADDTYRSASTKEQYAVLASLLHKLSPPQG